jgi:hypothetical protein
MRKELERQQAVLNVAKRRISYAQTSASNTMAQQATAKANADKAGQYQTKKSKFLQLVNSVIPAKKEYTYKA